MYVLYFFIVFKLTLHYVRKFSWHFLSNREPTYISSKYNDVYNVDKMLRILGVFVSAGIPSIHEPRDHRTIRPGSSQFLTEIGKYILVVLQEN